MNEERVHTDEPSSLLLIQALRSHLSLLMIKHRTPGLNIAVADRGKMIWEAGFGLADIASSRPMSPDSVYHSGSLGKTYTAVAIMILLDRGPIGLDDPINDHLPFKVHNPLGQRDITVHDLMVHVSGLGADAAASHWRPGRSLAEELAAEYSSEWSPFHGGRLVKRWTHPVGTAWTYSNLGIATLGLIVERANPDKLSFSEFVQRYIMDPLGMTHSCYPPAQHPDFVPPHIWAQTTTGYSRMGDVDTPTIPVYFREYPAGGVLARPADHLRLLLALMNEGELDGYRLLSPQSVRSMLSPDARLGTLKDSFGDPVSEQGLVWRLLDREFPWTSFGHSGGHMFGWRTEGRAWPNYGSAVVVAANQWSLPDHTKEAAEIAEFVGNWLRHRQIENAPAVDPATLSYVRGALLAGAYRIAIGIPGEMPAGALEAITRDSRDRGAVLRRSVNAEWDKAFFSRGFAAVAALPPTLEAIHRFWKSDASEVDLATAHAAYRSLGGRPDAGLLWKLLPPEL